MRPTLGSLLSQEGTKYCRQCMYAYMRACVYMCNSGHLRSQQRAVPAFVLLWPLMRLAAAAATMLAAAAATMLHRPVDCCAQLASALVEVDLSVHSMESYIERASNFFGTICR